MGMDLWIAIGFVAAISGLALVAGRRLSLSVYRNRPLLFVGCLTFSLVFAFGLVGRLNWANALPFSAAVCWSNWMPIFLAFTAGLASDVSALGLVWRKSVAGTLSFLAIGFLTLPVVRPHLAPIVIAGPEEWREGVCMQSHASSCGPAAAATLLHQTGMLYQTRLLLPARMWSNHSGSCEAMMADLCLTSNHGTAPLGLFRGLQIAVSGTDKEARIADRDPSDWRRNNQLPNVAVVRFKNRHSSNGVRRLLGTDGEAHAVVVHSQMSDGKWLVADPAVGWQHWADDAFRERFTGDAIYIKSRD